MNSEAVPVEAAIQSILAEVKPLAAEYYRLTGRPLGVTGEVAEYVAADLLGLRLAPPRMKGYDAVREVDGAEHRIQIKGRAVAARPKPGQRMGRINVEDDCDSVLLVLLDVASLDPIEMWEAPFDAVVARLMEPGSRARNERGALAVADFKRMATRVWPKTFSPQAP